jgi:hypothetical protein
MQPLLPPIWETLAVWFVALEFEADELAAFEAVWLAELDPPVMLPPAIETGTFAFTAF